MIDSEPVSGVQFLLYADNVDLQGYCDSVKVEGIIEDPKCLEVSDKNGHFVFHSLPPGDYSIVPHYQQQGIVFEVVPGKVFTSVLNDSVIVKPVFEVQGFSVDGAVLMSENGEGVSGAKIYLNGEMKATSDSHGNYRLFNMTSGLYLFQVESANIKFEPMKMKISPSAPNIPPFIPSKYSVCGKIVITSMPTEVSEVSTRTMQAWDEHNKVIVSTTTVDPSGNFCFLLQVGKYILKATISDHESSAGLLLLPEQQAVFVTTSIITDILFNQFMTSLTGSVTCLASCKKMNIALHRVKDGTATPEPSQKAAVNIKGSSASCQFDKVLPGPYVVAIEYPVWCWHNDVLEIIVDHTSKPPYISFVQTGFLLEIVAPVNVTLHYKAENITSGTLELNGGINRVCFDKPGEYSLTPSSCYQFEQDLYSYSSETSAPVTLKIASNKLIASVRTMERVDDIMLMIKTGAGTTLRLSPVSDPEWDEVTSEQVYHYQYFAKLKETLEITPSSQQLLFTPSNAIVTISNDCPQVVAPFYGKQGRVIRGHVIPPLGGVTITLFSEQIGTVTMVTDKDGTYSYGPILSDLEVTVTASKENHYFTAKQDDPYSFTTVKMSGVKVKVVDENDKALPGVLVSLSSASFRSNNFTDTTGTLTYTSLTSGLYHLRALLREYTFDPVTQEFELSSGESFDVTFIGKRVAFSCYGKVFTLSGHVVEGVSVQVMGVGEESCEELREETITDKDGVYRLRGLSPQCMYSVSVNVDETSDVSRATPSSRQLQVSGEDIGGVDFIVFQRPNTIGITGNVQTESSEHLSSLKVVLYRSDESVMSVVTPDTAGFFEISLPTSLSSKGYTVRMESSLSTKSYSYDLTEVSFTADNVPQHLSLSFQPKRKPHEVEGQRESFVGIILAVIIIFTAAQYQRFYKFFNRQSSVVQVTGSKRTKS
ncbi:BOS complex subunit NOMO1-like isoform X2 [Dysidea avara]